MNNPVNSEKNGEIATTNFICYITVHIRCIYIYTVCIYIYITVNMLIFALQLNNQYDPEQQHLHTLTRLVTLSGLTEPTYQSCN